MAPQCHREGGQAVTTALSRGGPAYLRLGPLQWFENQFNLDPMLAPYMVHSQGLEKPIGYICRVLEKPIGSTIQLRSDIDHDRFNCLHFSICARLQVCTQKAKGSKINKTIFNRRETPLSDPRPRGDQLA